MAGLFRIWMLKVLLLGLIDPSQASLHPRVSFSQLSVQTGGGDLEVFKQQHCSPFPYMQWADGSLVFTVTPETVNAYRCVSEELGFKQTIISFPVTLPVMPRSPPSHQQPEVTLDSGPGTEIEPIPDDYTTLELYESEPTKMEKTDAFMTPDRSSEKKAGTNHQSTMNMNTVCIAQKSYYTEMVAFCLLFVICLFVFIAFVVLWRRSMRCNKTTPQKQSKDTESD